MNAKIHNEQSIKLANADRDGVTGFSLCPGVQRGSEAGLPLARPPQARAAADRPPDSGEAAAARQAGRCTRTGGGAAPLGPPQNAGPSEDGGLHSQAGTGRRRRVEPAGNSQAAPRGPQDALRRWSGSPRLEPSQSLGRLRRQRAPPTWPEAPP